MPGPGSSQTNPLFPQVGDEEEEDLPSTTLPDGSTGLGDTTRSHSPPSARDMTASARGVRPPFGGSTVRASNGGVEILVGSTRNSMTARLSEEPVHIGTTTLQRGLSEEDERGCSPFLLLSRDIQCMLYGLS